MHYFLCDIPHSEQVDYCENNADCRRHLQLVHLGEKFDPKNCLGTCDNCSKSWTWIEKDVTNLAKQLVSFYVYNIFLPCIRLWNIFYIVDG